MDQKVDSLGQTIAFKEGKNDKKIFDLKYYPYRAILHSIHPWPTTPSKPSTTPSRARKAPLH